MTTNETDEITLTLSRLDAKLVRSVLLFEWENVELEDDIDTALMRTIFQLDEGLTQ